MSPRKRKPPAFDGRANNGGVRQGTSGRNYGQRSDLRFPSQEYGQGVRLQRSMQAVPMAQAPPTPQGVTPEMLASIKGASTTPTFGDPSARPDEPITAGMSFGSGRTPMPGQRPRDFASDDIVDRLRGIYLQFPTPELAELLDQAWL